ncbi:hypothetical protein [Occultella kanbiaonis]|uniref:hypothetical protein n=1 Tax=Occultella kanbiaonis TaxID=2675754 RepID=UPI0013D5F351|nr:hypothetical protein [Occultella kanbiaonis]
MADKRAYFKLDVGYLTNPKVAAASLDSMTSVILHIGCIAYSTQHGTDGVVPVALVLRITGCPPSDIDVLTRHGLILERQDGAVEVHDYLQHQRSAAEVKGAAEKAQKAANARWNPPTGTPSNASSMPDALRPADATPMPREREREREEEGAPSAPTTRATRLPASWTPTDDHRKRATETSVNIDREIVKFRTHAEDKGRTSKSWNAAFTQWLIKAAEYGQRDGTTRQRDARGNDQWMYQ